MLDSSRGAILGLGCLLAALTLNAAPARAHGAFPQSATVYEDPSSSRLWVGTSFGMLVSDDNGGTWFWICEQAPDYEAVKPTLGVTADGSLLVGSFDGVGTSHDGACNWQYPAGPKDSFISSIYVEPQQPSSALVMVSMGQQSGLFLNQVWATADNGGSFSQLGPDLDSGLLSFSLMSAPSQSDRLYLTGTLKAEDGGSASGVLMVSDNRGQDWITRQIPGTDSVNIPRILGVHPQDPDLLFLRADGDTSDRLLLTRDGGQTWTEELSGGADIFGFAFEPDLSRVRIGFGDARDPSRRPDEAALGIWTSNLGDSLSFERTTDGPIGCLDWIRGELYACTSQFFHGHELARSPDGVTWEPLLTLSGVEDVVSTCAADSRLSQECTALWPETCNLIGKCGLGAGGGGSGGSGTGGTNSAGSGGESGGGGCGCTVPGSSSGAPGWLFGAFGLGLILARRRRGLC